VDSSVALGKMSLAIDAKSVEFYGEDGKSPLTSVAVINTPTAVYEEISAPINVGALNAPVAYGLKAAIALAQSEKYTGTIAWQPLDGDKFKCNTAYTANITLKAKENYEFFTNSVVGADGPAVVAPDRKTLTFAKTFPKTGASTLAFNDNPSFDVPTTVMGTAISEKDLSGAVTGGASPYQFSLASGCPWLQVSQNGKITGTPVDTLKCDAVIKVTDAFNDEKTITISLGNENINFAQYTIPANLTATYGDTLSKVDINKGNDKSLGNWSWQDGSLSVGNVGKNTFKAIFTPNDSTNFAPSRDIDVGIDVLPIAQNVTVKNAEALVGEDLDLSLLAISSSGSPVTFTLENSGATGAVLSADGKTLSNIKAAGIVQIAAVATGVDKNGDNAMELSPSEKALLTITVPQPKIVITEQKITFAEKAI
ncbi:MAG: hypothetical protein RR315_06715, partial [Oscillospiraceae bacterium]